MKRIVVVPEHLRSLGSQLQHAAREINAIGGRVGSALGGLDWEARQRVGVDGQVNEARNRARALADQAEALARYLISKAQAFEQADAQSLADLNEGHTAPVRSVAFSPDGALLASGSWDGTVRLWGVR